MRSNLFTPEVCGSSILSTGKTGDWQNFLSYSHQGQRSLCGKVVLKKRLAMILMNSSTGIKNTDQQLSAKGNDFKNNTNLRMSKCHKTV